MAKAKAKAAPQRKPRNPKPADEQPDEEPKPEANPIAGSHVFSGRHVHVHQDGSLSFNADEWTQERNGITTAIPKPDRDGVLALIGQRESELLSTAHLDADYRDTALASLYAFRDLVQPPAEPETETE